MHAHTPSRFRNNRSKWKSVEMNQLFNYRVSNRFARVLTSILLLWCWFFVIFSGSSTGKTFYSSIADDFKYFFTDPKGSMPVVHLVLPILIIISLCTLLVVEVDYFSANDVSNSLTNLTTNEPSKVLLCSQRWLGFGYGDFNVRQFIITFVLGPSMVYLISVIKRHLSSSDDLTRTEIIGEISNSFAMMAEINMGFFLIPVSKGYNPLLRLFGLSPILATQIHIWAGRIAAVGIIIHGVGHIFNIYSAKGSMVYDSIIPPEDCWRNIGRNDENCYPVFRNFTGALSMCLVVAILLSSLNLVRRRYYRFFYRCHLILSPLIVFSACMHHPRLALYLAPGILYYLSSSVPSYMKVIMEQQCKKGIKLLASTLIPYSGGCVQLSFECDRFRVQGQVAQFVRMCVPIVSTMDYHPFTVVPSLHNPSVVNVIYRSVGDFTKELTKHLMSVQDSGVLEFLLDGFYSGPPRATQALKHDEIFLVAGGIGITPFISFLFSISSIFYQHLNFDGKMITPSRNVTLHWICRDEGLIQHILKHYLSPLLDKYAISLSMSRRKDCPKICVVIHHTDEKLQSNNSRVPIMSAFNSEDEYFSSEDIHDICSKDDSGVSYTTTHGNKLKRPLLFSPSKSISENLRTFLTLSLIAWTGLYIIWSQYIHGILERNDDVIIRVWGIVGAILASVVIVLILEGIIWVSSFTKTDIVNGDDGIELKLREMDATPIRNSDTEEEYEQQIANFIHIEHSRGRPNLDVMCNVLTSGKNPGIFMCGPPSLTHAVKDAIKHTGVKCAIYEESFIL